MKYNDPNYHKEYYKKHREIIIARTKKWREVNLTPEMKRKRDMEIYYKYSTPERRKRDKLKYRYGISLELYKQIIDSQGGKCSICMVGTRLHVDHCHKTKKIRGIICSNCNIAIGMMNDDIGIMEKAIAYLKRSKL